MAYKSYSDKVLKVLKDNKREFCERVGVLCVGEVQSITPVGVYPHKTGGTLRRGVTHDVMQGNKGVYVGVIEGIDYALAVEKGTSRQRAQHYTENGCMNAIPKIKNVAEDLYRRLGN